MPNRAAVLWATRTIAASWLMCSAIGADTSSRYHVDFADLLREMADRTVLTRWPSPSYRSLQASSYHRAATTPDDPASWFANGDQGFVLRTETRDGQRESVLMEHGGPGVLTRIWTPFFYKGLGNREGPNIRIYLDGETTPRIDTNFIALVTGKGPVKEPFAQPTCRAGDLYLPICFGKSCKVTVAGDAFFYIINYRAYAKGTLVETFEPEFLAQHRNLLEATGRELVNPTDSIGGEALTVSRTLAPQDCAVLALPAGPSAVRHLCLRLRSDDTARALRSTVMEMMVDGEQTVWCPVGDFFSNINGLDPYEMWEREVRPDGTMICRWIMPWQTGGEIRLRNLATQAVAVDLRAVVSPWQWTRDSLHFRTNWWTDEPYAPRPVRDLNFIEVTGRGIHVGDTMAVLNPLWSWWGEGDEKIYVDEDLDRRFPSHFGTGSEDYYGWAGGEVPTRKDEFSTPFLANVRVGGETRDWPDNQQPYTHGYNICARTRSLDATPFARRFKFDMEAFNMIGTPDAFLQYALVTHWYGAPGATHNRPPLPEAAGAPVPQTEDVAAFSRAHRRDGVFHIKDAIELERVKHVTLTPGLKAGTQHIGDALPPHKWSDGSHFWGRATKPGEGVTFALPEQYQPRRILLYPTVSYDYGTLRLSINDQVARQNWDGFDPESKPGKPIDLGVHAPVDSAFRLRLDVTGKNPASRGYFFGVDAVVLASPDAR